MQQFGQAVNELLFSSFTLFQQEIPKKSVLVLAATVWIDLPTGRLCLDRPVYKLNFLRRAPKKVCKANNLFAGKIIVEKSCSY